MKKVAVVLCGSGFKDGSEIRESVAVLWALSQQSAVVQCFAPDAPQADVINCLTGKPMKETQRNMLVEAARIARGNVLPLSKMKTSDYDALILPGGFGAAKNLCTFAQEGIFGSVLHGLKEIIESMYRSEKAIGAVCIAPVILAMALKDQKLELTVGESGEASQEIEKLGHRHVVTQVTDCHIDKKNRIVTTSAYMHGKAELRDVFTGIQKLVEEVVRL